MTPCHERGCTSRGRVALLLAVATFVPSPASAAPRARGALIPLSVPLEQAGFARIAQQRGVTVYKDPTAKNVRIGAEGRLPASPERVLGALLDYERQVGKIDRLAESRVLLRRGRSLVVYQRLALPVIRDRDYVLLTTWGRDRDTLWISYRAVTDQGPAPGRGVVRVTEHRGSWQLKPTDGGRATLVRYQLSIDMAGSVPRWLVKSSVVKEVPDVFAAVAEMVAASAR